MWVTRYLHLRKELKDGDVIAFDGETLVDDVIVSSHHLQYVSHERLVDIRYIWFLHSYYPPHNCLKSICLNAHHITSHLFVPARELHALRKVNSLSCEVCRGLQETFTGGEYGHVAIVCNCLWDEAVLGELLLTLCCCRLPHFNCLVMLRRLHRLLVCAPDYSLILAGDFVG